MIDSYVLRQIAETAAMIDRFAPELAAVRASVEQSSRFAREVSAMSERFSSPFEKMVLQDRTWTYIENMVEEHNQLLAGLERHNNARMLISVELPKRGWYLSGQEPCGLLPET